jgi:hypothetical protein
MDDTSFDQLARWFLSIADRRHLLRRSSSAVGVVVLGLASASDDAAGKKRRKKRCRNDKKRCGKKCVRGNCCPGRPCGGSETCSCLRTTEGDTVCTEIVRICGECVDSSDCASIQRCVLEDGCIAPVCATLCNQML